MPAVAGMGPLTAGTSAAPTVLVCRRACTTAWEHACMPVAGTSYWRPFQRRADGARAAVFARRQGTYLHASRCRDIPLLPAFQLLVRTCVCRSVRTTA